MGKVKLALLAWEHKEKILIAIAMLLFVPFVAGAMMPGFLLAKVPMVPDHLMPMYQQAAGNLRAPDGTQVTGLAWHQLVAIDAVRFEQDFSRVTQASIAALAQRFIKTVKHEREVCETVTDPTTGAQGRECRKEVTYTYELHSPEAVMAELAFSADQMEQAGAMLADGSIGIPGAPGAPGPVTGDCSGWQPNPVSRYFWPAGGVITSCFGGRIDPVVGGEGFHTGIDVAAATGTPIRAAQAGKVTTAAYTGNYGNLVVITGTELQTYYGHLSGYAVRSGQTIRKGDVIGYMGTTGKSTGPHLHFETRPGGGSPVDPRRYFQ